jgi:t-SNARE complex subunit (syntaxin)
MAMINKLTAMFRDFSLVVFEQVTIINGIDTRIDLAVENTRIGNEDLDHASQHRCIHCFYIGIEWIMAHIVIYLVVMFIRQR